MVSRAIRYYSTPFKELHWVAQGGSLSPWLLNIVVGVVVIYWLIVLAKESAGREGFDFTVQMMSECFYVKNGLLTPTQPKFLHWAFDVLVGIFEREWMNTNVNKMLMMVFQPCIITSRHSDAAYVRWMTGERPSYQTLQQQQVKFTEFAADPTAGYLAVHHQLQHGKSSIWAALVAPPNASPITYRIYFHRTSLEIACPV